MVLSHVTKPYPVCEDVKQQLDNAWGLFKLQFTAVRDLEEVLEQIIPHIEETIDEYGPLLHLLGMFAL